MEEDMTLFSPEILQGFLGGIGDGFMLTDLEGRVLYGNRAAKEILGYAEKLGERPLFSELCPLVDVVSGQPFPDPLAQAVTEERSVGLAKNIGILRDGQPVFLSATCSPIKAPDGSGRVLGGSVILRDVTRMRGLEMKVESDQRYMRAVFSAAGTGLCILNAEGEVVISTRRRSASCRPPMRSVSACSSAMPFAVKTVWSMAADMERHAVTARCATISKRRPPTIRSAENLPCPCGICVPMAPCG